METQITINGDSNNLKEINITEYDMQEIRDLIEENIRLKNKLIWAKNQLLIKDKIIKSKKKYGRKNR